MDFLERVQAEAVGKWEWPRFYLCIFEILVILQIHMFTAIIFIIVLGVLVFVHEFGHFIFAKRAGMKVVEFSFGFPPRLWGIKKGETLYWINAIPFGGFVKILGEEGEQRDNPRSFSSKPVGSRLLVIVAGVTMNFFLAAVLLMVTNFFGLRIGLIDDKTSSIARNKEVQIIEVSKDSPADKAGVMLLDEVTGFRLNGSFKEVFNAEDVQSFIHENVGQPITLVIKRNNEILDK